MMDYNYDQQERNKIERAYKLAIWRQETGKYKIKPSKIILYSLGYGAGFDCFLVIIAGFAGVPTFAGSEAALIPGFVAGGIFGAIHGALSSAQDAQKANTRSIEEYVEYSKKFDEKNNLTTNIQKSMYYNLEKIRENIKVPEKRKQIELELRLTSK